MNSNIGPLFDNSGISYALPKFGCFVLWDCIQCPMTKTRWYTLFHMPMGVEGEKLPDEEWVEVTAPESQEFLDAVNAFYGTKHEMRDFRMEEK